jgi:molybdopterin-guanine dinucleotide biosynthesis protein A
MGSSKATLPFGPELMLQRVVRLLSEVVSPIVVVAARQQALPELPSDIVIARDEHQSRGPLEGLRAGLHALSDQSNAAFATSCDVPLLVPAFVERMVELLDEFDAVVPVEEEFHHPLAAVYRRSVVTVVERLLNEDRLRPVFLFEEVNTLKVNVAELECVDPELTSLMNLNHPRDYYAALERAGFPATDEIKKILNGG